jgi:chaperonin GroES
MSVVTDRRPSYDLPSKKSKPRKTYVPMNDRVLLKRLQDVDALESKFLPEAFQTQSNKGEVVAVGSGMIIGSHLVPIDLKPGDVVLFGQYNAEVISLDGEDFILVSAFDVRLKAV